MKLLRSLLTISLSSVAVSSLSPASVYYFPPSQAERSFNNPPSISFAEAKLVLAHRFGLSKFHDLGEHDAQRIASLSKAEASRRQLLSGNSEDTKTEVVIAISGVKNTKDFLPDRQPDFIIEKAPDSISVDKLFSNFQRESSYASGRPGESLRLTPNREKVIFAVPKLESAPLGHGDALSKTYGLDKTKSAHARYILEQLLLDNMWYGDLHSEINRKDTFIMLHLRSLEGLLGDRDTSVYDSASDRLTKRFHQPDIFDSLTIVVLPPSSASSVNSDSRANELKKRREVPISITNSPVESPDVSPSIPPITKADGDKSKIQRPQWNGCYTSEEACSASTNDCSGHGKCISSHYPYKDCWTCHCTASELKIGDKGTKKVYWSGSKCQKQDISVQFHIFFVFTIAMILGIGGAIRLLFSVGNEELPGVLTAGVVSKKA